MKTTIDIADPLLTEAKRVAAAEGITLRQLVEDGLRRILAERSPQERFCLRDASVEGQGVQPGLEEGDWSRIRGKIYKGRGG